MLTRIFAVNSFLAFMVFFVAILAIICRLVVAREILERLATN
ncbi:hypothetical protein HanOQP8_Chr02g0049621 [Helianthus annuus]|nr:hypothetical protein HanOQP8_Chr02g0049621 [Helianthus annuus]